MWQEYRSTWENIFHRMSFSEIVVSHWKYQMLSDKKLSTVNSIKALQSWLNRLTLIDILQLIFTWYGSNSMDVECFRGFGFLIIENRRHLKIKCFELPFIRFSIEALPEELYMLWFHHYPFNETVCKYHKFAAESFTNATVLTITAFTIER